MSAAYKYTAFQTLCIPTEGTAADADATTPDPIAASAPPAPGTPTLAQTVHGLTAPAGYEPYVHDMTAAADQGTPALMAAWNKSQPDHRRYLSASGTWEALKARAAKAKPQAVPA
jgi:hypothetical protein